MRVELTEADYQKREGGGGNILDARISYSRALANPVRITFTPLTYDQFFDIGMTLPDNFPHRTFEAGGTFMHPNVCRAYFSCNCFSLPTSTVLNTKRVENVVFQSLDILSVMVHAVETQDVPT